MRPSSWFRALMPISLILLALFIPNPCLAGMPEPAPSSIGMGDNWGFGPMPSGGMGGIGLWITNVDLVVDAELVAVGSETLGPPAVPHAMDSWQDHIRQLKIKVKSVVAIRPDLKATIKPGAVLGATETAMTLPSEQELKEKFSPECIALWRYNDSWELAALGRRASFTNASYTFDFFIKEMEKDWEIRYPAKGK